MTDDPKHDNFAPRWFATMWIIGLAGVSFVSAAIGWQLETAGSLSGFGILFFWLIPLIVGFVTLQHVQENHVQEKQSARTKRTLNWIVWLMATLMVLKAALEFFWGYKAESEVIARAILASAPSLKLAVSFGLPALLAYSGWRLLSPQGPANSTNQH